MGANLRTGKVGKAPPAFILAMETCLREGHALASAPQSQVECEEGGPMETGKSGTRGCSQAAL